MAEAMVAWSAAYTAWKENSDTSNTSNKTLYDGAAVAWKIAAMAVVNATEYTDTTESTAVDKMAAAMTAIENKKSDAETAVTPPLSPTHPRLHTPTPPLSPATPLNHAVPIDQTAAAKAAADAAMLQWSEAWTTWIDTPEPTNADTDAAKVAKDAKDANKIRLVDAAAAWKAAALVVVDNNTEYTEKEKIDAIAAIENKKSDAETASKVSIPAIAGGGVMIVGGAALVLYGMNLIPTTMGNKDDVDAKAEATVS